MLYVTYTGEQWRVANAAAQKLVFEYQVAAPGTPITDLKAGTWLPVTNLDFTSPTLLAPGATAAAVDGNAAANRTAISYAFPVSIPAGDEIMLRWKDLNDAGSDHALAIDDLTISAYTEAPPSILSTAPAKGDTGVARDANINITFSEAVNFADANWYTLTCATSGAHDVVVSNSGSTFTLNPNTDFGYSEVCTGTVLAAKVTDVDSGYNMLADYSFSFTTVAPPDLTVTSTNPVDGATNVPVTSPFVINFSGEFGLLAGVTWYTFTCGGDPVPATDTNTPTTITLTPDANLPYNALCTVTLDPSLIIGAGKPLTGTSTWSFTTQWQPVTVTSTEPANGATNVAVDTTFEINFNQSVAVTGTWYTFTCNGSPVASSVAPAGPADTYTITPSANLAIINMCTVTLTPANITSVASGLALTGTSAFTFSTPSPDGCPVPPVTHLLQPSIGSVQGTELTAAKTGNLTLKGTITNRSVNGNGATPPQYGFYIQDAGDGDPLTSDGMFVYTTQGSTIPVGSAVMVTGAVSEYNKGTQITPVASTGVVACGTAATITPLTVNLPEDSDPDKLLERFENMLVHLPQEFTIDQNYYQGRYGQLTLSPGGRLYTPTNGNLPGTVAEQITANNRRMIVLDDNNYVQNPTITPYLGTGAYPYADIFHPTRAGDLIQGGTAPEQGLTGILDQGATNSFTGAGAGIYNTWYRLQPMVWPTITRGTNLRTAAPVNPGGNVKVAGFNLLNYFTTLDIKPYVLPYDANNTPRGADSQIEFERQRAKTVAAIIGLGADVTGVIEVENNGETAISDLVDYLNLATAPGTYDYVRDTIPLPPTSDFIKAAIIYKPMAVTPVGTSVWGNAAIFDRPPLAQTFKSNLSGEKFSVVVNHFKSKGCGTDGATVDPDLGQGCWNVKRTQQAEALLTFIETTLVPVDPDVVAVGDYNAYGAEDPIKLLTNPTLAGALIDELLLRVPSADRYTYVFDGQAGYLDHMLLSPSLNSQVTGVSIWHLNADESGLVDYNTEFKTTGTNPPDPYDGTVPNRASDHDPILIGLNLNSAPQVATPIPAQSAIRGRSFQFTFADNAFSDANLVNGDRLTYTADLESGAALPAWLQFNAATRTFSGTPDAPAALRVRVTATDQSGASVSTVFTLTVKIVYWLPLIGQ
jgi:predicted extracellular nuclease